MSRYHHYHKDSNFHDDCEACWYELNEPIDDDGVTPEGWG